MTHEARLKAKGENFDRSWSPNDRIDGAAMLAGAAALRLWREFFVQRGFACDCQVSTSVLDAAEALVSISETGTALPTRSVSSGEPAPR